MLLLVPVLVLLVAVAAMLVLGLIKFRVGSIWLVGAVLSFGAWLSWLPIAFLKPVPVEISKWLPDPFSGHSLVFSYTNEQWTFGFLLISLLVAVIFSEAKYLDTPNYLFRLTGSMLLAAFGLLAILSRSILAFVLAWSLIDLVEFGAIAVLIGRPRSHASAVTSILARVLGILFLVIFFSIAPVDPSTGAAQSLSPQLWWLLILLVLFRMGTLPLYQPYIDAPVYQRGIISLLRTLPMITTFAFISFIVRSEAPEINTGFIFGLLTIAILYASLAWFSAADEIKGRPHWIFAMAGFGLATLLTGDVDALMGIAAVLVVGGSGLFLYSPRMRRINPFIVLLVSGLFAIPFTPSAAISGLFSGTAPLFFRILWVICYAILISGVIKHAVQRAEKTENSEPWMLLFHTIALYFIAAAPWLLVGFFLRSQFNFINWWPWITTLVLVIVMLTTFFLLSRRIIFFRNRHGESFKLLEKILLVPGDLLRFAWIDKLLSSIGFLIDKGVRLFARVLEGDGGVLWSFLFIVLLLSLLLVKQAP